MSTFKNTVRQTDNFYTNLADPDAVAQWDPYGYTDGLAEITIFAKNVDDRMWMTYQVSFESFGAGTNLIGTPQLVYDERDAGAAAWTVDITIEDTTKLTATCTGDTTTIEWFVEWAILEYRLDVPYP